MPYLDGGLADSVPIGRAHKIGNEKIVVVLTKNRGYRKKVPSPALQKIYRRAYRSYPELVRTILRRSFEYNKTMNYLDQLENLKKMGSADKLLEMIPGAKGNISEEDLDLAGLEKEKAIIKSMTKFEKENYRIIGPSRRKRIAKGSGTSVADVARLLKKFEKSKLMMKPKSSKPLQSAQKLSV